jgi:hypothetical protein
MLTGLDILLDRMKTNPEEFLIAGEVPYEGQMFGGKWADLLTYAWRIANEEERNMLEDARRQFYRDDFNERVMKRLAGEDVESKIEETSMKIRMQGRHPSIGSHWTDPRNIGALQEQGYQIANQPQIKQEGAAVGTAIGTVGNSFWGGITNSLKGQG